MALDRISPPSNSDGMTIEVTPGADGAIAENAQSIEMLPASKLPPAEQFRVLSGWWRSDADFSHDWRAQARTWFDFRAGEQYTAEDKSYLDSKNRPHVVFNRVLTILKAIAGMEINSRHEIQFIPRNTEDTKPNEVLSAASKWMGDECDGEDEESQAFEDTATIGLGCCENRMSYEDDPSGLYVEEKINCLEMYWDRTARKKNISDARRVSRVRRMPLGDAMAMFPGKTKEQIDATWAVDGALDYPQKSLEQKWKRDENNTLDPAYNDLAEVTIVQIQWIERESYWLVADEQTNSKIELTDREYQTLKQRMEIIGMKLSAARLTRKVYKQAFLGSDGQMLRPAGPSPIADQFSWKFITGELDTIKGTWFGLVKTARDPQMWANKFFSQIMHILNTTAKGGILAERSAFDDEREGEDSYAQADEITWLADGALSGDKPKVMEKPGQGRVDAYLGLMTTSVEAIHQTLGINLELIGQRDINQPGVLEAMRKQAGMTVLATLFDSLRRFRKQTGRARLYFIQNFLSDGRLMRVVGPEGAAAVPLAKDKCVGRYDVIIDDAPTSPNQKEANWAIIQPLLAVFRDELMQNPQVFVMLLEYSPLPARIVDAIKAFLQKKENDPKAQQELEQQKQLAIAAQVAVISKDQSIAELNNKKAGATEATAMYDIAMAKNLLAKNDADGLKAHLDLMEAAAKAKEADANAEHSRALATREHAGAAGDLMQAHASAEVERAKASRERTGAVGDLMQAHAGAEVDHTKATRERVGQFIDQLSGAAGAHRDMAAARKDHAAAKAIARKPAQAST